MTESWVSTQAKRRSGRVFVFAVVALVIVVALSLYALAGRPTQPGTSRAFQASTRQPPIVQSNQFAPNGAFTTPSGSVETISSLRPKPTMIWLVAGGCASCAASIPAVAQNIDQLRRDGLQVVTLGLYGSFSAGRQGVAQLLSFGRAAAGTTITRPGWIWGMASRSLSESYDPSGTPDVYTLVGPRGHIRYTNSVPVSTMPQLLAAARHLSSGVNTKTSFKAPGLGA